MAANARRAHAQRILYGGKAGQLDPRIDQMAGLVAPTLGPIGGTVAIESLVSKKPEVLDSGATIARRTIQFADPFEDMGGMLIRHLLLTVFERVGDGTATTAVLTRALVHGLEQYGRSGGNVRELERGLQCGLEIALDKLTTSGPAYRRCSGHRDYRRGGRARFLRLPEIVGEILDVTGADGAVIVEGGEALETTYEYVEGARWDEGLVSEVLLAAHPDDRPHDRAQDPDHGLRAVDGQEQVIPVLEDVSRRG